ncbi:MAG: YqgE/AlgH family protein [Pseudomonadales bacterium]|nr:YqgE/AlgH family protein [Pseudomonadales bacterium]MDP7360228.1 YqgE/AlgH family protein [Pseudomonadales bacterium]MDP7596728.1 YqgE/AlgH family protein [Pseudomonadales bacterium]HJN50280.1 YqgE/AlgH family protein [Pseudomonadales bacterium]
MARLCLSISMVIGVAWFCCCTESLADDFAATSKTAEGFLLIADEGMMDPRFKQSVLLMIKYDADGSMGIMINHPTRIPLASALPDVEELEKSRDTLFIGGPVSQGSLLVLFEGDEDPETDGVSRVFDNVYFTMRNDALAKVFNQKKPVFKIYTGFAGWSPGQLEGEIDRGDWHLGKAVSTLIFEKEPTHIWPDLTGHPRPIPPNSIQARTDI